MADKKQETPKIPTKRPMEEKGVVTDVLVPLAGSGLSGYVGAKVGQGAKKDK